MRKVTVVAQLPNSARPWTLRQDHGLGRGMLMLKMFNAVFGRGNVNKYRPHQGYAECERRANG